MDTVYIELRVVIQRLKKIIDMQRYGRNADCKDQFYPLWFGCIENELNRSQIFNNLKIISCILGKNQLKFLRIA
jgi:hypothetical protein